MSLIVHNLNQSLLFWDGRYLNYTSLHSVLKSVWVSDCIIISRLCKSDLNAAQVLSERLWMKGKSGPETWSFWHKNQIIIKTVASVWKYLLLSWVNCIGQAFIFFWHSELKAIGPAWFVPPGPSLSWMSSQHFFTGRMLQIRAAHAVQHAPLRQILQMELIPLTFWSLQLKYRWIWLNLPIGNILNKVCLDLLLYVQTRFLHSLLAENGKRHFWMNFCLAFYIFFTFSVLHFWYCWNIQSYNLTVTYMWAVYNKMFLNN